MKNVKLALMAGLAFATFAAPIVAQENPEGYEHHEMSAAKLKDKLGLTDDQVTKLDAATKANREAMKPLHEKMKADMDKLRDQVKNKASDDDVKATLDDLDAARKSVRDAMDKHIADVRGFLTPTQQAKLALWHAHRMKEMRERMRGMRRGGPEPKPEQ